MNPFVVIPPSSQSVPILLSVPHCGTLFPDELREQYDPMLAAAPDDTDWFVHELYNFAAAMGIGMIHATYSRWVIDLNRDPQSKPLYTDGRIITGLCPTTDFFGNPIYTDKRTAVEASEVARRVTLYYEPYHAQIQHMLNNLRETFDQVLLWDCHSIRQQVPTIHAGAFPDLILGNADDTSASPVLTKVVVDAIGESRYSFKLNEPFKGGYITRHFGKPAKNQHALQLEMTKINYMDDVERAYSPGRAAAMQTLLKTIFTRLVSHLS